MALTIDVLGPLTVAADGVPVTLPRSRERAVLSLLVLAHPGPISVDALVSALWETHRDGSAQTVRSYVSRLRQAIGSEVLRSTPGGYALSIPSDVIDAGRAARLVADAQSAHRAGDLETAIRDSEAALSLWRGTPFADLTTTAAEAERQRLDRLHRTGTMILARALLDSGRAASAVDALIPACVDAPLEEPLWALLIRALHADGHRDEALRRHDELRRALSAELGMDPGEEVRAAHEMVMRDPVRPAGPPVTQGQVERDGRALAYVVIGDDGPALLYLHGGLLASEMMLDEPSAAMFTHRLAAHRRLLMVDAGGIGLSDPMDPSELSYAAWAADIDAVMRSLAITRADVVAMGFALGPALHLAVAHPHRVRRLVIGNSPALPAPRRLRLEDALAQIDAGPAGRGASTQFLAPSRAGDQAFTDWLERSARLGTRRATARAIYEVVFATDIMQLAGQMAAPTLVLSRVAAVGGEEMQALADVLPDVRYVGLEGADALPYVGDADAWLAAALAFLDEEIPTPPQGRLMAVAVTASDGETPVVTAHDLPAQALAAAQARTADASVPYRAVVHVGIVNVGAPTHGPAVTQAVSVLTRAASGTITRTEMFDALDQ